MKRPREAPSGDAGEDGSRFARVDGDTLRYFTEIAEHIQTLDSDEDKQLIADNALEETKEREQLIVPDAVCSRVLEALIPHASPALVVKFIEGCILDDNLGVICTR